MKFIFIEVSEEDKEKIIIVCKRYAKYFFILCLLGIFSLCVFSSTKSYRHLLGSVLTATGVFAKSGWSLQTWDGDTMP